MPTIPASRRLTADERACLDGRRRELRAALRRVPATDESEAKAVLVAVTKMLLALSAGSMNERVAEAKGEAYLGALDDIPAWCVVEAIRRWNRGDCGAHNYDFAPSPAVLRGIAEGVKLVADGQIAALTRLLAAEPVREFSEAERAANIERFVALMAPRPPEAPPE